MTDKTEAQPEALRLADALAQADRAEAAAINYGEGTTLGIEAYASAKTIRAQHAEIQQLKAKLSARQAAPDAIGHVRIDSGEVHIYPRNRDAESSGLIDGQLVYAAAPPPPEREPLTDEQIARAAVNAGMKPIYDKPKKPMVNALGSSVPFTWLKAFAHGIGATND